MILPTRAGDVQRYELGFEAILAARWMPDGREVLLAAREPGRGTRLYRSALGGAAPKPVSGELAVRRELQGPLSPVAPDGAHVTVLAADGRALMVPLDGGAPQPAAGLGVDDFPVQWTADSKQLYAFHRGGVPAQSFKVDVASGARTPFHELRPPDAAGVVAIRNLRVTPDGRAYAFGYNQYLSTLYLVKGIR